MSIRIRLRILALAFLACTVLAVSTSRAEIESNPNLIFAPEPVVPAVALRKGWGGKGVYRLEIDPRTGTVEEVKVLRRVGYPVLDAEMVMTLFKWRFKPHSCTHYTLSYQIGILGRARDYHTGRY